MKKLPLVSEVNATRLVSAFHYVFREDFHYDGECHEGWEFVFVDSGRIMAKAGDKRYIIKSGEMICHKPMEYHNLNPYHGDASATIFCFHCADEKMRFFENKIISVNQRQRLYLNDIVTCADHLLVAKSPLEIARDGFMEKRESATASHVQFMKNTIELLILSLYSSQSVEVQTRANSYTQHLKRKKLTDDIKNYLQQHMGQRICLEDIAAHFSYSVSTIKTVFKEETGQGIMEYYNALRLEAAKQLLEKNNAVGEIAETLGFLNSSHFSNFFKKATGIPPHSYVK